MNTQNSSTSASQNYLEKAADRKILSMLLAAIYAPLFLMLGAALFIA